MKNEERHVDEQANDWFKPGPAKADPLKADPLKEYQALAKKTWEAFAAHLQKQFGAGADDFFKSSSTKTSSANPTLDSAMAGLKSYADWMQGAAASVSTPQDNWRQQMNQLFAGANQPFSHGFSGAHDASAKSFVEQWQAMLQSIQKGGVSDGPAQAPSAPPGFSQEQQAQQQDLAAAIARHLEAAQRYQSLIQRSNAQAMEKMQARLAQLAVPGQQIESLKVLYDLWVDCAEEAYAEIALTDEFREAYGEMVNTQMRVRQSQQEQTEYLCQQLGIPTRSEVSSLGERLQSLRREMRNNRSTAPDSSQTEEIAALRREVAALRHELLATKKPDAGGKRRSVKKAAAKPAHSAVKKSVTKPPLAKSGKTAAGKTVEISTSRAKSERTRSAPAAGSRKRK